MPDESDTNGCKHMNDTDDCEYDDVIDLQQDDSKLSLIRTDSISDNERNTAITHRDDMHRSSSKKFASTPSLLPSLELVLELEM